MKLSEYKGSINGLKIKTPKGVVGYIESIWNAGVLLSSDKTNNVYPQFFNNTQEFLEWEITEDEVNSHKKTSMEDIDNTDN